MSNTELKLATDQNLVESHLVDEEADRELILSISKTINIKDPTEFLSYGSKPMAEISKFSDGLLSRIKMKDTGEVGDQLASLVGKINEYQTEEEKNSPWWSSLPVVGKIFHKVERVRVDHTTITEQVDIIASRLDNSMVKLLTDNEHLEVLYNKNFEYYKDLDLYVKAGETHLEHIRKTELVALENKAMRTKDLLDSQKAKDLMENINRFERRLHDLNLSKTVAMHTAPQIRIIQDNNQQLAEKIQGSIFTTLPMWKSQIVLAISLEEQERAVKLQTEVSDTTNRLLRRNAEMLQQNSIMTAHEAERAIVDIETVRDVQNKLVNTIEETMKIATEAREKRLAVEKELSGMEEDLRKRISSTVEKYTNK